MMIRSLELRRFRGIEKLTVPPRGDVVLVGEPRAGRSRLLEGLFRVLSPDGSRGTLGDDLDLHDRDRGFRAEVEVVVGDLGDELVQRFFDEVEHWDDEEGCRVDKLDRGVVETRAVHEWAEGERVPGNAVEQRFRVALQVALLLSESDGREVTQAWFQGLNPQLDDRSPARLLREGTLEETGPQVLAAARAFLVGG